ncbi:unnamed protein product, partial [Mesorhabditis belari]|uniref:SSD domain-containing protein n=1 Tax=Mesorhabditis belari TaxID=2138241 RepID=A0AAF3EN59_9BILA
MLTLLEPPGAKRPPHDGSRSEQHLLHLGPAEDDAYYDESCIPQDRPNFESNRFVTLLENLLVWRTSSSDYTDKWKKEFRQRPSFCDADLCLQQIRRGQADGNIGALYTRSFIQKGLNGLGNFVQANAYIVIALVVILFSICCYGLQFVHIETDIVKLWVDQGGRLDAELSFLEKIQKRTLHNDSDNNEVEMVRENGLGGGYQVVIQTPEFEGDNALSSKQLLKHVQIMREIANYTATVDGVQWSLSDICFKPAAPTLPKDSMANNLLDLLDRVIPCIWITPIDCFWEGSKALGPQRPLNDVLGVLHMLSSIPSGDVTWKNFDPIAVIEDIHGIFPLGTHYTFFQRTGIGHGYLDRPCINPIDLECPKQAPNYWDHCPHLDSFLEFARRNGIEVKPAKEDSGFDLFSIFGGRRKRQANESVVEATTTTQKSIETTTTPKVDPKERCKEYRKPMLEYMATNRDKWNNFLVTDSQPKMPDFGKVMSGGCPGFAKGVLHWPEDMILGGARRPKAMSSLESADALQSVFLVASPNDVYLRFKAKPGRSVMKQGLNESNWNPEVAEKVIATWQRNFTRSLYQHAENKDENGYEHRTIHPLASTSIADMLQEFCQFNYLIIFVGYGLMLVYAVATQLRREGCLPAAHSCMGLAFAGVFTVTFASIAGLGLSTWFGIEFNAATTQIVPFLTLGIGVDNMFMLLHNYHDVVLMAGRDELGMLMRETGMSLLTTSINNILSFLAGTLLPIPALRSFCAQSSILLTFNFVAILTLYPALIALDLKRRKSGRRDLFCCLTSATFDDTYSMINKPKMQQKKTITLETSNNNYRNFLSRSDKDLDEDDDQPAPYSLHSAIRNHYIPWIERRGTKAFVLTLSVFLTVMAVIGMQRASIGLELSDVLPEHTAPAAFLKARDKYFSFYPMFAVLKGPNVDYARQQHQIDNYRRAIGASEYVIRNAAGEPSEKYWLQMMRDWLLSIQMALDKAVADGKFDLQTGQVIGAKPDTPGPIVNLTEDALIAYRLVCSKGNTYNCTGRVGRVRLVDSAHTINHESFYNYLTAWYNSDNMMYYVSQASFYPRPPKCREKLLVPPAEPLAYSQIPFYLTGLTTTPVIVEMIKDIRQICDNFTDAGLPNFPQGIAFTFWEQYLHLSGNLLKAIALIAFAVFVVISLLLFNPWAAGTILVILVCMTVQLAGFMGWAGVKMNPVSAVTLITAVGIGVEFTAHVVLAFLTALGTREERTRAAVDRVFVPVIHGALSTLLGILMLAFSEFEFVVKYFFVVMSALIVIGLINGLMLLPVLLSLSGPSMEVKPINGGNRLKPPPPLRRRCGDGNETDEEDDDGGLTFKATSQVRI